MSSQTLFPLSRVLYQNYITSIPTNCFSELTSLSAMYANSSEMSYSIHENFIPLQSAQLKLYHLYIYWGLQRVNSAELLVC